VVIGGLVSATLLTLLVLPALYARLARSAAPASAATDEESQRALHQPAE
jgi:heavy metal efflux system protein